MQCFLVVCLAISRIGLYLHRHRWLYLYLHILHTVHAYYLKGSKSTPQHALYVLIFFVAICQPIFPVLLPPIHIPHLKIHFRIYFTYFMRAGESLNLTCCLPTSIIPMPMLNRLYLLIFGRCKFYMQMHRNLHKILPILKVFSFSCYVRYIIYHAYLLIYYVN